MKEIEVLKFNKVTSEKWIKNRRKFINEFLGGTAFAAFILFILSACALDSDSWIPAVVCAVCVGYLFIFLKANGLLAKLPRW